MRKLIAMTTVCAAACGVLATQAAALAHEGPQDFRAVAKVTHAKAHGSNGAVFREVLKRKGHKIGHAKLRCTFRHKASHCSGRWRLRNGTIKAHGKLPAKGHAAVLRIKRGTRLYSGARGTVTIAQLTEHRNRESFHFK